MQAIGFLWIIASYLLGSLPFGFLFGRWFGKKNVLAEGWQKTSATNVARVAGFWPAVLTGAMDLTKGFLAVWLGQKLGLSQTVLALSGVAAIVGHNWSCFLRLKGGRGVATFIGAGLALSPQITILGVLPFLLLALIWNSAIGTLVMLAVILILIFLFGQFLPAGLFIILASIIILIKRLNFQAECKEILAVTKYKRSLTFCNRLVFDNDQPQFQLRLKNIIARFVPKTKEFSEKTPLEMTFLSEQVEPIFELKPSDIKNFILSARQKLVQCQEEINRINVFPVADKDTGYNLAATLRGISEAISQKDYDSLFELSRDIERSALQSGQGNAGMILAGWLLGFLSEIKNKDVVNSSCLIKALEKAAIGAELSIAKPVEGTILDAMKAATLSAAQAPLSAPLSGAQGADKPDIAQILKAALARSEKALGQTQNKLAVLRKNKVVDAGALGFVKILEAWVEVLSSPGMDTIVSAGVPRIKTKKQAPKENENRFETVCRFRADDNIDLEFIKQEFSLLGDSLDFISAENEMKLHIHTSFPEKVREKLSSYEIVEWRSEELVEPVGIVVCDSADLTDDFIRQHSIERVFFTVRFPSGEVVHKDDFFNQMREAIKQNKPLSVTAAPSIGDFLSAFQKSLNNFETVLVITPSAKLSAAYTAACSAREMAPEKQRLFVFDCDSFEMGEGFAAMKAQEFIGQGKRIEEIIGDLEIFCPKIKIIGCLANFAYVARSGRVKLPRILVAILNSLPKIGLYILVALEQGKVRLLGLRAGYDPIKIIVQEIEKQTNGRLSILAVAHGDCPERAQVLKEFLEQKLKKEILFVSPLSSVIGLYTGPDSLVVGFVV